MEHTLRKAGLVMMQMAPAMVTVLLVLLSLFPERLTLSGQWMPQWTLVAIYFCGVFRRSAFPFWLMFVIGLVQDALTGLPLGLTSFIYLVFFVMIHLRRKELSRKPFVPLWVGFGLLALGAVTLQWLCLSLYHMTTLPLAGGLSQWCVTVCVYPFLHTLLSHWLSLTLSLHTKEHISRNYAHRSHH